MKETSEMSLEEEQLHQSCGSQLIKIIQLFIVSGEMCRLNVFFFFLLAADETVSSPLSALLEGGLIGVCSLVLAALPYLPDASLMLCLRETLLRRLLQPIADVVTSASQAFGRGAAARSALAAKLVDCAHFLTFSFHR